MTDLWRPQIRQDREGNADFRQGEDAFVNAAVGNYPSTSASVVGLGESVPLSQYVPCPIHDRSTNAPSYRAR